ncbi:hypothetical protein ACJJTC_013633 [Scirpophaga incertulas]
MHVKSPGRLSFRAINANFLLILLSKFGNHCSDKQLRHCSECCFLLTSWAERFKLDRGSERSRGAARAPSEQPGGSNAATKKRPARRQSAAAPRRARTLFIHVIASKPIADAAPNRTPLSPQMTT